MTLNEIIKNNPEFGDLPVVVYGADGEYHYVGDYSYGSGDFYKSYDEDEELDVLVFTAD
jgi:hypothetical protein